MHSLTFSFVFAYLLVKFKDEIDFATFDNLMEKYANVVYELSCLASNIQKKSWGLDPFLSFLKKYEKKSP